MKGPNAHAQVQEFYFLNKILKHLNSKKQQNFYNLDQGSQTQSDSRSA